MVRVLDFHCHAWVQSLTRELRSSKPQGAADSNKKDRGSNRDLYIFFPKVFIEAKFIK